MRRQPHMTSSTARAILLSIPTKKVISIFENLKILKLFHFQDLIEVVGMTMRRNMQIPMGTTISTPRT